MRTATLGKKFAAILQAMVLVFGMGSAAITATALTAGTAYADPANCSSDPTAAADPLTAGASCAQAKGTKDNLFAPGGIFQTVANTIIFLVGAVAVIMLIIGGLRYVVSNGDSKAVESAKNTILYAIVGIVVAVISFALVNFVISALNKAQ